MRPAFALRLSIGRTPLLAGLALLLFGLNACGTSPSRRRPPAPVPPVLKAVIRTAKSYLPEEEQKKTPPLDCSDYVQKVFAQHGVRLPRTSIEMSKVGTKVESSRELRMGDLLFFSGEKISRSVGHVGIYVNNGIFIHRPNVGEVRMESLHSDYYRKRYLSARRIVD